MKQAFLMKLSNRSIFELLKNYTNIDIHKIETTTIYKPLYSTEVFICVFN